MTKPDFEEKLHQHICHWIGGMPVVSVGAAFNMLEQAYAAGRTSEREECAQLARKMGREPWGRCTIYSDILGDKIAKAIECMGEEE